MTIAALFLREGESARARSPSASPLRRIALRCTCSASPPTASRSARGPSPAWSPPRSHRPLGARVLAEWELSRLLPEFDECAGAARWGESIASGQLGVRLGTNDDAANGATTAAACAIPRPYRAFTVATAKRPPGPARTAVPGTSAPDGRGPLRWPHRTGQPTRAWLRIRLPVPISATATATTSRDVAGDRNGLAFKHDHAAGPAACAGAEKSRIPRCRGRAPARRRDHCARLHL